MLTSLILEKNRDTKYVYKAVTLVYIDMLGALPSLRGSIGRCVSVSRYYSHHLSLSFPQCHLIRGLVQAPPGASDRCLERFRKLEAANVSNKQVWRGKSSNFFCIWPLHFLITKVQWPFIPIWLLKLINLCAHNAIIILCFCFRAMVRGQRCSNI